MIIFPANKMKTATAAGNFKQTQTQVVMQQHDDDVLGDYCCSNCKYDKPLFLYTSMLLSFLLHRHAHQITAEQDEDNYYFLKDAIKTGDSYTEACVF